VERDTERKTDRYGIRRLLKMTSLFCKKALLKRRYSAKEACNSKVPTIRSHPIVCIILQVISLSCRSFSAKEPLIIGLFDKMRPIGRAMHGRVQ